MSESEASDAGTSPPLPALSGSGRPRLPAGPEYATPEGFVPFYRGFTPRLVAFLMYQGAPLQLALDLVQETMIIAYRKWGEIHSPAAWARRVASRELVRHFSRVEEEPVDQVPDEANALLPRLDELAELENRQALQELMKDLPPRQRQVLAWSVSGYSPSEIAEELGIRSDAVRSNLRKARHAVAQHMNALEEGS